MRIDRFVLDNNIWVSYFITQREQKLIDIISNNDLTVFSCTELIEEARRVLGYPHLLKYHINIPYALNMIRKATTHFEINYPIKRYVPNDAADDYLIALALQTSSGFITSGDDDILSEKENLENKYRKLKILTKKEFEDRFRCCCLKDADGEPDEKKKELIQRQTFQVSKTWKVCLP